MSAKATFINNCSRTSKIFATMLLILILFSANAWEDREGMELISDSFLVVAAF
jgi:hypothetical protein